MVPVSFINEWFSDDILNTHLCLQQGAVRQIELFLVFIFICRSYSAPVHDVHDEGHLTAVTRAHADKSCCPKAEIFEYLC